MTVSILALASVGTTMGTSATRRSPGKISFGTPTIIRFLHRPHLANQPAYSRVIVPDSRKLVGCDVPPPGKPGLSGAAALHGTNEARPEDHCPISPATVNFAFCLCLRL